MLPIPPASPRPSRRGFLVAASAAGGGLLLGFEVPGAGWRAAAAEAGPIPFDAYLRIAPDGRVTVLAAHMDMGQGIYSGIATLVAEELDAAWSEVAVEGAAGNPRLYGNLAWGGVAQGTGGSTAIKSSFERYRRAGAIARAMLVEAAARRWGVPGREITVAEGVLTHPSGRRAGMGELALEAAALPVPAEVQLKDPSRFRLIGNPAVRRLDSAAKTTGRQLYTSDLRLPGMLTAVVAHPPLFGAVLRAFDASRAKAVPGVVEVVQIPRGVAVVAETTWAAIKGREALALDWDTSRAETRGTAELMALYRGLLDAPGAAVARQEGDPQAALAGAARRFTAEFTFPYLAHAPMEPMDAAARLQDGVLEVWGGHQMPDQYQAVAAEVAGVRPDQVRMHVMMTGGGFGRRAVADADVIVEAVATARALGWRAPVKVVWTREDDMAGGRYRPMYLHRVEAGLDAGGDLVGWRHRIVGQSILAGTPFAGMIRNGVDLTSVEGAANLPYAIPAMLVELVTPEVGVPVLWWRSVGSTHTAYATEVFVDELAVASGKDPVAFRLALLRDHPRHASVLRLAAEKAGWGTAMPAGSFRGVAVHESFNTFVAQVAEIRLVEGRIRVERVVCAVDCGIVVNPDIVRAQMEGGIGMGLGAALKEELTLEGGRVVQTNYADYEILRIDEMPRVEVHIVPSTAPPTGVGEPGLPPIAPAVANAVAAATGKRVRSLPFARHDLRSA